MMNAPLLFTVSTEQFNQRLDNFLLTRLKGLPKSCLYRLLRQGKIRVNQKRKQPSYRLQMGDCIKLPHLQLSTPNVNPPKPGIALQNQIRESILFEDKNLLILNKPQGLAVHGGSGIHLGLIETLRQLYPPHTFLELAHRLDRETSGCLIVVKKSSILKEVHQLFRAGVIQKTYFMLVKGHWPEHLHEINAPLKKNQLRSGERMVVVHQEGKQSLTQFKLSQQFQETSLVEVTLHTGRTHQIRVHASYAKHPIVGDDKYGDKQFNQMMKKKGIHSLFLHAHALAFHLPSTGQDIAVKAPIPLKLKDTLNTLA
jgi:23S rRNA pseudouridine955/2504/2580 synthase